MTRVAIAPTDGRCAIDGKTHQPSLSAAEALASPEVSNAIRAILGAGRALGEAGRFREARTTLMLAMETGLRLRFLAAIGKVRGADREIVVYVDRLKGLQAIGGELAQSICDILQRRVVLDRDYVERLYTVARATHAYAFQTEGGVA